jgi:hypothetical protein
MTYTISGKQYTEFDINKRCAELMEFKWHEFSNTSNTREWVNIEIAGLKGDAGFPEYNPWNNPADTDAIINKCWDELMDYTNDKGLKPISHEDIFWTRWESLMNRHKCTKLVAACICLIELNTPNQP